MILSTQRPSISFESDWVLMEPLVGEHNVVKVLLDIQAILHVFKNLFKNWCPILGLVGRQLLVVSTEVRLICLLSKYVIFLMLV